MANYNLFNYDEFNLNEWNLVTCCSHQRQYDHSLSVSSSQCSTVACGLHTYL